MILPEKFGNSAIKLKIWLSARHLPGHQNTTADAESRRKHDNTEWQLNPNIFKKLIQKWPAPSIDLFASRINCQIKTFQIMETRPRGPTL